MGNVDIRPDMASEGGGLIDDFDGTISDLRFGLSPEGYVDDAGEPVTVGLVTFDVEGEEHTEILTIGGKGDFAADDTGRGLNKLKSKATLTKTCKFIRFMDSLVNTGFPLNRMDSQDVSPVIGTFGHFLRETVEYAGLKKKGDRENTVLLCTNLIKLPWETKGGKGKGGAKGGSKAGVASLELSETVAGIIQGIIIGDGGDMAKKDMLSAMFKDADVAKLDDKKAALKLASNDTFLKGREEWTYEDGVLKMK